MEKYGDGMKIQKNFKKTSTEQWIRAHKFRPGNETGYEYGV